MNISKYMVTLIALAAFTSIPASADDKKSSDCAKPGTPQELSGKVTAVDMAQQQITFQDSSGTTHVMKAAPDTLKGYKPGDTITATLRCK